MADYTYDLDYPIARDNPPGGTIYTLDINRPTMLDIDNTKQYLEDAIPRVIWIARLMINIATHSGGSPLTVTEAGRLDLADCLELIRRYNNIYAK